MQTAISRKLAEELSLPERQVTAAVQLLDEGATVPFIARYRKEVTGGLDDTQMRQLEERLHYRRELEQRRDAILASIEEQGKLSDGLRRSILEADSKNRLEDLYLPYRKKRRTRAQMAREAGLEPLAQALLDNPRLAPEEEAAAYLSPDNGIADIKSALDGARQILMERFAENADLLAMLRRYLAENALLAARLVKGKQDEGEKFRDYFEHTEALAKVPSHRALAMFRGRNEGVLGLSLIMPPGGEAQRHPSL